MIELGRELGMPVGKVESQNYDSSEEARKVAKGVARLKKTWLLVFDNADDAEAADGLVPRTAMMSAVGEGHVVVTTQLSGSSGAWFAEECIEVLTFDLDEAVELLQALVVRQCSGGEESFDRSGAACVAELVGKLPLALVQVGAYVARTGISFGEYAKLYQSRWSQLMNDPAFNVSPVGYGRTVLATWQINMDKVRAASAGADDVMLFCSLLDAESIPMRLIVRFVAHKGDSATSPEGHGHAEHLGTEFEEDEDAAARQTAYGVISVLHRYSLVRVGSSSSCSAAGRQSGGLGGTWQMHRVVQAVVRASVFGSEGELDGVKHDGMADKSREARLAHATKCARRSICAVEAELGFSKERLETWKGAAEIAPHADQLVRHVCVWLRSTTPDVGAELQEQELRALAHECMDLASATGDVMLLVEAQYARASGLARSLVRVGRLLLGNEHPAVAASFRILGEAYLGMGEYAKAIESFEKALEIAECALGEDSPALGTISNSLGLAYERFGEHSKAVECLEKALETELRAVGEDHPDVATNYNNAGLAYHSLGNYARAGDYHERALKIRIGALGEDHPDVARSCNNLGNVHYRMGNYALAVEFHERALAMWLRALGQDHPDVAISYTNLGVVYGCMRNCTRAAEFHEKALKIFVRALGEDHPDVARCYSSLGAVANVVGEYASAVELLQKAVGIRVRALGDSHPSLALSYNNLGAVYIGRGDYTRAVEFCEKALRIQGCALGDGHPDVALSYQNLGQAYYGKGEYPRAVEFCEKARGIWVRALGENHPNAAVCHITIGLAYSRMGEYAKAAECFGNALRIQVRALGQSILTWIIGALARIILVWR